MKTEEQREKELKRGWDVGAIIDVTNMVQTSNKISTQDKNEAIEALKKIKRLDG